MGQLLGGGILIFQMNLKLGPKKTTNKKNWVARLGVFAQQEGGG